MSNTLVVDTSLQAQQRASDFSVLGFRSVLPTITTITGQAEDPLFPFTNTLDFRDNTKYSPLANSVTVVIQFDQATPIDMDYFAFAIHNSQDAQLTGQLEVDEGAGFVIVAEFASIKNNRPFLKFFGVFFITFNFSYISLKKSEVFFRCPTKKPDNLIKSPKSLAFFHHSFDIPAK